MKIWNWNLACAGIGLLTLAFGAGCVTPLEAHWGESVRQNKLEMIENPYASEQHKGLDPATGEAVMEKYQENQRSENKEPNRIFLIRQ